MECRVITLRNTFVSRFKNGSNLPRIVGVDRNFLNWISQVVLLLLDLEPFWTFSFNCNNIWKVNLKSNTIFVPVVLGYCKVGHTIQEVIKIYFYGTIFVMMIMISSWTNSNQPRPHNKKKSIPQHSTKTVVATTTTKQFIPYGGDSSNNKAPHVERSVGKLKLHCLCET